MYTIQILKVHGGHGVKTTMAVWPWAIKFKKIIIITKILLFYIVWDSAVYHNKQRLKKRVIYYLSVNRKKIPHSIFTCKQYVKNNDKLRWREHGVKNNQHTIIYYYIKYSTCVSQKKQLDIYTRKYVLSIEYLIETEYRYRQQIYTL